MELDRRSPDSLADADSATAARGGDKVFVLFAVNEEARPFFDPALLRPRGASVWAPVRILVTGMGAANAEREFLVALAGAHRPPEFVLTCGFAGGLAPHLSTGTVVFEADPNFPLSDRLRAAGAKNARFHCARRVIISVAEKAELYRTTGADAVEMESEIIRRLARERGIPSATVRVISDAASETLPLDFNALMTPEMELDFARLIGCLVRSPGKIPELIRFGGRTKRASARLAGVLAAALG